jgi:hypothetical protein
MSVQVMNPQRPKFASNDLFKGTAKETKVAIDGNAYRTGYSSRQKRNRKNSLGATLIVP